MKNKEYYESKIIKAVKNSRVKEDIMKKYIYPFYDINDEVSIIADTALLTMWLDKEYEECGINWNDVKEDTPILVRNSEDDEWERRYFAKYNNDKVFAWFGGNTSWTTDSYGSWNYAKLVEEGDKE